MDGVGQEEGKRPDCSDLFRRLQSCVWGTQHGQRERGGERDRDERKDLTKDGLDLFLRALRLALIKLPYARPCEPVLFQLGVERVVGGRWAKDGPADGDAAADGVRVRGADVGFRGEEESLLAGVLVRDDGRALRGRCDADNSEVGPLVSAVHVSQPFGRRSSETARARRLKTIVCIP